MLGSGSLHSQSVMWPQEWKTDTLPTILHPTILFFTFSTVFNKLHEIFNTLLENSCYCCWVTKFCPTLETPWTVAHQAPLSMEFPRQEYWNGLPFPYPGNLLHPGIEPASPASLLHYRWILYLWATEDALDMTVGHDKNWLEPARSKMADKLTSSRPWASNDTPLRTRTVQRLTIKGQKVGDGPVPGNLHPRPKIARIILPFVSLWNYAAHKN